MALTKKMLKAMNLEDPQIEQIFEAHEESISALRSVRDDLQDKLQKAESENERLATVEKDLARANMRLEDAQKAADDLKQLRQEYDAYKLEIREKTVSEGKRKAYKKMLVDAGIPEKRHDAILKVTDLAKLDLAEDGTLGNAADLSKTIKSEWADFIVTEKKQGADTPTPPTNTGGSTFEKMSLAEKMSYANEHPDDTEVKAWLQ